MGKPARVELEVGVAGQVASLRRLRMTPLDIVQRLELPERYLPAVAAVCAGLPRRFGVGVATEPEAALQRQYGPRRGAL